MEALLVVAQQRNQYYSGLGNMNSPARFCGSQSRGFRDMNCRSFDYGPGLLPSPCQGYESPLSNSALLFSKTLAPGCDNGGKLKSVYAKSSKKPVKSAPIAINLKVGGKMERALTDDIPFSERWAGPAYSNSPPPSSVPIPKFSMKPKRTVSLELPVLKSDLSLQPMAKSAPASPTREPVGRSISFLCDDDYATKSLRRILNLDIADH